MIQILERALVVIFFLTLLIAWYFHWEEGLPLQDALITSFMLFTAGEPMTLNPSQVHWTTGVVMVIQSLLGLATLSIVLTLLTNIIFSEKVQQLMAKKKVNMENHIILCGLGNVGYRVLKILRKLSQPVVVVDWQDDKELCDLAKRMGVPVIPENLKREKALELAGIEKAKSIIICTGNDLLNMEVALNAREKRPDIPIVLRMFDTELAKKLSEAFNIRVAFSSSQLAAPVFAAAAIDRSVFGALYVDKDIFVSARKVVQQNSTLDGMRLEEFLSRFDVSVIKLVSGEEVKLFPIQGHTLKAGDILFLLCPQEVLFEIKKANQPPEGELDPYAT